MTHIRNDINRWFRKLHPIDVAFIAAGIIFLGVFYVAFRRDVASIAIRVMVINDNIAYSDAAPNNLSIPALIAGDVERDELGRVDSTITNVESYRMTPDQRVTYLDINTKATYDPRKGTYSIHGEDILFGQTLTFSFSHTYFKGVVVSLPGLQKPFDIKSKYTIVKARNLNGGNQQYSISGVPDYIASAVQPGDQVVDGRGNVLAKILDVSIVPAKRITETSDGQALAVNDPEFKDVNYTIELATQKLNGETYMYDYNPVQVGETVPLFTKNITVWPTITEIVQ